MYPFEPQVPTEPHPRRRAWLRRWTLVAIVVGATPVLAALNCAETEPPPAHTKSATSTPEQQKAASARVGSRTVDLRQVDGGPRYYAKFRNPLPSDPSYFPIGTWLMSTEEQRQIDEDKAVGVNLYVAVNYPEGNNLSLLRTNGMKALIQADERTRFSGIGTETAGWLLADELDMTQGPAACPGSLRSIKNTLPVDGRARYTNYSKGVLFWETDAEAACFVDAQQLVSSDLYWFTDPYQRNMYGVPWLHKRGRMTLKEVRRAANYGYQVDRMRALDARDGHRKPIWNFVEVGWPFTQTAAQGGRAIEPGEIRAAVWHSIIAGARGIVYFDHQFGGPCTDRVLRRPHCYPENRAMVKSVNQQIKRLAPVLNAPFAVGLARTNSPVETMAKYSGGTFYIFAGSRAVGAQRATFRVPCIGDAKVTVVGEKRKLSLTGGSFKDSFANGNAVHIYRIDGGSTCGLPTSSHR